MFYTKRIELKFIIEKWLKVLKYTPLLVYNNIILIVQNIMNKTRDNKNKYVMSYITTI